MTSDGYGSRRIRHQNHATSTNPTSKGHLYYRRPLRRHCTRLPTENIRSDSYSAFKTNPSVFSLKFQQPVPNFTSLVKSGYPPRALTIVPELPFDSLGLQRSDQIIVSEIPNPDAQIPSVLQTQPLAGPVSRQNQPPLPAPIQSPPPKSQSHLGPDHVEVDGSFLIHRVSMMRQLALSLFRYCSLISGTSGCTR